MFLDALIDALLDCVKMLPFLFAAFLLLEALEHHVSEKMNDALAKTRKLGPLVGSLLGCVPQCGFSILASNFYAGGVISLGTLLSVYLATSDEALVILISGAAPAGSILAIIAAKVVIGVAAGYLVMGAMHVLRIRDRSQKKDIGDLCRDEACGCHDENAGLLKPALNHTLKIFGFIFVFTLALNILLELIGLEHLSRLLLADSVFQPLLAALIGLIPNCAASVILTQLYVEGILSFGSVVAGLGSSAGLGLVVLFRVNRDRREDLIILGLLYGLAVASGVILQIIF